MTATLTPALALAYLRELSPDVRAAVVLDGDGGRLAGDASLLARARALLERTHPASTRSAPADEGILLTSRAADGTAIVVLAGSRGLVALLRHDVERTLEQLVRAS
jgi:hypothetical protein